MAQLQKIGQKSEESGNEIETKLKYMSEDLQQQLKKQIKVCTSSYNDIIPIVLSSALSAHNSGGDIAVHLSFWLKYGYMSLTINWIAFVFYTHFPKNVQNTFPRFFGDFYLHILVF